MGNGVPKICIAICGQTVTASDIVTIDSLPPSLSICAIFDPLSLPVPPTWSARCHYKRWAASIIATSVGTVTTIFEYSTQQQWQYRVFFVGFRFFSIPTSVSVLVFKISRYRFRFSVTDSALACRGPGAKCCKDKNLLINKRGVFDVRKR